MGVYAFLGTNVNTLYVPYGSIDEYKYAPQWSEWNGGEFYLLPIIQISSSADTVHTGSSVTCSADTCPFGIPVTLQWEVNGKNVGNGDTLFSYIPVNSDTIICKAIIDKDTVISNAIIMNVSNDYSVNIEKTMAFSIYPNPNDGNFMLNFLILIIDYKY